MRKVIVPPPEPCALHTFRHQSNFLSAPQSVSSNFLETDWVAIFQWNLSSPETCAMRRRRARDCTASADTARWNAKPRRRPPQRERKRERERSARAQTWMGRRRRSKNRVTVVVTDDDEAALPAVVKRPRRKDSAEEGAGQCFWCVNPTEDSKDGRCLACRTKYENEPLDASLGDSHPVFVRHRLASSTGKQLRTANWRLQLLVDCFGADAVTSTPSGDGLDVTIGPFVLLRSGAQGQKLEAFSAAVMRCNEVLTSLLDCFACLAARRGKPPEATIAQCNQCHTFLEAEVARLRADAAAKPDKTSSSQRRAIVCVRDAIKNLKVMVDDTPPLSDAHRKVSTSAAPVLSKSECQALRLAAEDYAAVHGWTTKRHVAYPTHDLPTTVLGEAGEVLERAVATKLLPEMAARFGLDRSRLGVLEMFLAKYSVVPGGLAQLEEHEDGSQWSFVIALNDATEYAGGGTKFVEMKGKPVFRPAVGCATLFSGKNRHCGMAISAGVRYILAGFCSYTDE